MALAFCALPAVTCAQAVDAADAASFDPHDLRGIWNKPGGGRYAQVDVEALKKRPVRVDSAWAAGNLPFTAAGREVFDERIPVDGPRHAQSTISTNDPRDQGNPLGLYRSIDFIGTGRSFEMMQTDDKVVQLFSLDRAWRAIYTDGRPVPEYHPAGPFWYGYSVGHWEGSVLVVDTVSLDERAWLDDWGTPISPDAQIQERWERVASNQIVFTMTVNDPTYYTEPWTSLPLVFVREVDGVEPFEIITAPIDASVYYDEILSPSAEQGSE